MKLPVIPSAFVKEAWTEIQRKDRPLKARIKNVLNLTLGYLVYVLRSPGPRRPLEFGIGTTFVVFVTVTLLFATGLLRFDSPTVNPTPFLTTSVAILATVLAIVVSVALLGIQLTTETFAPSVARVYAGFRRNLPTVFLYSLFSAGVLYNLWGLLPAGVVAFGSPSSPYLAYSYFLTFMAFSYLAIYLAWTVRALAPENLISIVASKIDAKFAAELQSSQAHRYLVQEAPLKENPLGVIEQLSFRAIERGERRQVYLALVAAYLPMADIIDSKNQDAVENFFALSLVRLSEKALSSSNPEIAGDIVAATEEMLQILREGGIPDPPHGQFFGLSEAIKRIGISSASLDFPSVTEGVIRSLHRLFDLEIEHTIPRTDSFFDIDIREETDKEERESRARRRIRWEDSTRGLIWFFDKLADELFKRGQDRPINTIQFVLSFIAQKLSGLKYRDRVKRGPYSICIHTMIGIEKRRIELGLDPMLHDSLQDLWNLPEAFGELARNGSINVLSVAVNNLVDPFGVSWHLGYLGRVAADGGDQSVVQEASSLLAGLAERISRGDLLERSSVLREIHLRAKGLVAWSVKQTPPLPTETLEEDVKAISELMK